MLPTELFLDISYSWAQTDDAKRCTHIFLGETDYIWVRPLPPQVLKMPGHAISFPFGYIVPTYPTINEIMRRYYPADKGPLSVRRSHAHALDPNIDLI